MLNLIPWRQEKTNKDIKKCLFTLLILIISGHIIFVVIKNMLLDKTEELRKKKIEMQLSMRQQMKLKEQLKSKVLVCSKKNNWRKAMMMQQNILLFLRTFPDLLPLNSYLTELAGEGNRVILQGILFSSSAQGLQNFINACKQYGWSLEKQSLVFLGVNQQRFYMIFANGRIRI